MALVVYRRHRSGCPGLKQKNPRTYWKCACPVWVQGRLWKSWEYLRESLDVTTKEGALAMIRQWEIDGEKTENLRTTTSTAIETYIADCKARKLSDSTMKKVHHLLLRAGGVDPNKARERSETLTEFCTSRGIEHLDEITPELLLEFRAGWVGSSISNAKKLERLKGFFNFCVDQDWLQKSPSRRIKPPSTRDVEPTLPFDDSKDEIERLHAAIPTIREKQSRRGPAAHSDHLDRLAVLMRVMEYTGLRVGDAVGLETGRLNQNRIFLRQQQKTKTPVWIPIPASLADELRTLTTLDGNHWFWSGKARLQTAVGNYRRSIRALGKEAGVANPHPHRFRDTLAVRLLEEGVPVESVSQILGHADPAVTIKHYSPWVKRLQERAEAAISQVWDRLVREGKGSKEKAEASTPARLQRVK